MGKFIIAYILLLFIAIYLVFPSEAENGVSVTETSRSSQIGGAILAGIVAGGVGAIIGGLSGKTTTTEIKNFELRIIFNNTENPVFIINFQHYFEQANHWYSLITVLIKQADKEDEFKSRKEASSSSVVDELQKLAELKNKRNNFSTRI